MLTLQTVLDRHARQIRQLTEKQVALEELPNRFSALSHEFAKLRNDVTAPIGHIGLHQRAFTRVLMGVAEKLKVDVSDSDRVRLDKPLPGEAGYVWSSKA